MKTIWRSVIVLAAAGLLSVPSFAAQPSGGASRLGLGINLNRADARLELDSMNAVSAFIGLDTTSDTGGSLVEFGGYYLKRFKAADPVAPHMIAGLSYAADDSGGALPLSLVEGAFWGGATGGSDESLKRFTLFAGVGAEYFLPGTKSLSIEGDVGLLIQFVSNGDTVTRLALGNLAGGLFMLRYYFDLY